MPLCGQVSPEGLRSRISNGCVNLTVGVGAENTSHHPLKLSAFIEKILIYTYQGVIGVFLFTFLIDCSIPLLDRPCG